MGQPGSARSTTQLRCSNTAAYVEREVKKKNRNRRTTSGRSPGRPCSTAGAIRAMRRGLNDILPLSLLRGFTPQARKYLVSACSSSFPPLFMQAAALTRPRLLLASLSPSTSDLCTYHRMKSPPRLNSSEGSWFRRVKMFN